MIDFFVTPGPVVWLSLGFLLLAGEALIPAILLMWFGFAAIAMVPVVVGAPYLSGGAQWSIFAVFSLISGVIGVNWMKRSRADQRSNGLNMGAGRLIGREATLQEAIVSGYGVAYIDDTVWRVSGPDSPSGSKVRVTRFDGVTLIVVPID